MNIEKRIENIENKLGMSAEVGNTASKPTVDADEIDLVELWKAIWSRKLMIIVVTSLFSLAGIYYALSLPNVYRATALLSSANDNGANGLNRLAGQFGGIASLAGINIGGGSDNRTVLALEVIKSRSFLQKFINDNDISVALFASESWDPIENKLQIDPSKYDVLKKEWMRNSESGATYKPSPWDVYKKFREMLIVDLNKDNGMVSISIEFISPELARSWVTLLVESLNKTMRNKDKADARASIDYLSAKLEQTQLADMQEVFFQLIEEQTKTIMLAEVSSEYILKTIDPSNVPDEKASPARAIIVIMVTMLGGMLSVLFALSFHFSTRNKVKESE